MPRNFWNCCVVMVAVTAASVIGCAKPAENKPAAPAAVDSQSSSTTGGGAEVPMPAAAPAEPAPAAAPAEPTPAAEPAPAEKAPE